MAKISLRMYDREIESLVEQSQRLDEAIAHCRHILQTFPKHLETYRLLGKAYLEAKRYDQAVDIFQRVLVAVPDDFVSHVGMSIIADDKGRLDDAIWHMERAFEVQPSNAAIQGELQRLFGRRDGVEPPKIRLTRGALAHMYVQGELYNQAISEIRAVLNGDPKRTDMQTLLARAYYRNGQKAEAADICADLIGKYPYCLDANRLMVEIAPSTQRADTAQEYRQRVIELDPYAAFATDSVFHADNVADNLVTIERLEYTGESAEMPPSLGIGLESDNTLQTRAYGSAPASTSGIAPAGSLPAWLSGAADEPAPRAPAPPEPDKNDLPDFLRQAGWDASSGAAEQAPSPFDEQPQSAPAPDAAIEGDLPAWVKALAPAGADTTPPERILPSENMDKFRAETAADDQAASNDMPDWLRSMGDTQSQQAAPVKPDSTVSPAAKTRLPADAPDWLRELGPAPSTSGPPGEPSDEAPDWLKDLGGRELDEPAAPVVQESETDWIGEVRSSATTPAAVPAAAEDESPDWLKDFGNDLETPMVKTAQPEPKAPPPVVTPEPPASLGSLGTSSQEQDDAMAWLEGLAAKHGAKPEELVTDPNARTEVAPEWVDKAKEIGEQHLEQAQPAAANDETGMWLRNLAAEEDKPQAPQAPEQPAEDKPLDFRSSFADQTDFGSSETSAAADEQPIMGEAETPDWLRGLDSQPAGQPGSNDLPEWLHAAAGDDLDQAPLSPPQAEVPPAPSAEVPLAAVPDTAPQQAEEIPDQLPAWLAGLDQQDSLETSQPVELTPLDDLPSWLKADAEPEPASKQPADPADWRPIHAEEPPVQEAPPVSEAKPQPVAQPPARPAPQAAPKPEPTLAPVQPVAPQQQAPAPAPAPVPAAPRPRPVSVLPKAAVISLGDAQSQLGRGNIAAALDIYGKLIRKGKSLEDIIRDLRDALYRYPVEVPLWQSLGDAYMRANRLQEALDAYTKAEELLR